MKLIDSSGWIEFFMGGPLAGTYASHLRNLHDIVTPTVVLYKDMHDVTYLKKHHD